MLGTTADVVQIAAAVDKAGAETDQQIKAMLQHKAQEIVSKLDLHKALSLDVPPEQIVAEAMQQANAQLQSEGGSVLHLAKPTSPQALSGTSSQVHLRP